MLTLIPSVTQSLKRQLLLFPQQAEKVLVMADKVSSALVQEAVRRLLPVGQSRGEGVPGAHHGDGEVRDGSQPTGACA